MIRQTQRSSWMCGRSVLALVSILSGCGGMPEEALTAPETSVSALEESATKQKMIVYSARRGVDESSLVPLGPPEALGGRVIAGSPSLYGRIDYSERGMTAGIFKATTGTVRIVFPFTEHATILEGEVTITDESGQRHTFRRGDSYFIRQGQVVIWDVKGRQVIKSFFNYTE